MPKIKELIEVPEVKTVIELATVRDSKDSKELESLVSSFILTDDVRLNLEIILQSIASSSSSGLGFFLIGAYGSGKSHFLSLLSLLFTYPEWVWPYLLNQCAELQKYQQAIGNRKFLVCTIPLLEYRSDEPLDEIIFASIEQTLGKVGISTSIADDSFLLEQFNKYILPRHFTEFFNFCKTKRIQLQSINQWSTFINSSERNRKIGALLVTQFLRYKKEVIPIRFALDWQNTLDRIQKILNAKNYSGIILLIDELSEFFRAKPDTKSLNEDARFLQFLGERSQRYPIWIISALQEAIEKTGEINQAIFNKIKDRYPRRLTLSTKHIKELIDKRLIIKKSQQAVELIKSAYQILKKTFNEIKITESEFIQIYPIHPETLELLEICSVFFSAHRGIVDFIYTQVKGTAQVPGILEEEYTTLLTPDRIFDHFSSKIKETAELAHYYELYETYFAKRIPRIFESATDRENALKLIKILLLLKMSPVPMERTSKELANMALISVVEKGAHINYEYVADYLLPTLANRLSYIKCKKGTELFGDIYYLDLESKAVDLVESSLKKLIDEIELGPLFSFLFKEIGSPSLPFVNLYEAINERENILWNNTYRSGLVRLTDLRSISKDDLEQAIYTLKSTERDFILYLATLDNPQAQADHLFTLLSESTDRLANGIIIWRPMSITAEDDLLTIKRYYAAKQLLSEYAEETGKTATEVKEILSKIIEKERLSAKTILENAYYNGVIYNKNGVIDIQLNSFRGQIFDHLLAQIISQPLEQVFIKHYLVAPKGDVVISRNAINFLFEEFIVPGYVENVRLIQQNYLRTLLESVVKPLGLAKKRGKNYELLIDLSNNELLNFVLTNISEKTSLEDCYWKIRKSEYGLVYPLYELIISALIRKGYLIGYKDDNPISPGSFGLPLTKYITAIGPGRLVNPEHIPQLKTAMKILLNQTIADFDASVQEEIWEKLRAFKEKNKLLLTESIRKFKEIINELPYSEDKFTRSLFCLTAYEKLLSLIDSEAGSYDGLTKFIVKLDAEFPSTDLLNSLIEDFNLLSVFLTEEAFDLIQIYRYLKNPYLVFPEEDKYQWLIQLRTEIMDTLFIRDELIYGGLVSNIKSSFAGFLEEYSKIYTEEHNRYYAHIAESRETAQKIINSQEVQVLKKLANIEIIPIAYNYNKITALIEDRLFSICRSFKETELARFPVCICGFKLGSNPPEINFQQIKENIINSIRGYLSLLQEQAYSSCIQRYIEQAKQIDKKIPEKELIALLSLNSNEEISMLVFNLLSLLKDDVIVALREALSSAGIKVVKRNLAELIKLIPKRKLTKREIIDIVSSWLDGEEKISNDTYIIISTDTSKET